MPHADGGAAFWISAVVGWIVIILGVRAGLNDRELKPALLAKWLVGGLVLHDAIWLIAVAATGSVIAFAIRRRLPLAIGWAVATSVMFVAIAWPFVRGYGLRADNPSVLPRNYAHGLLAYLAATWILAMVAVVVSRRRRRGRTRNATNAPLSSS
jgi:hypothetical protein